MKREEGRIWHWLDAPAARRGRRGGRRAGLGSAPPAHAHPHGAARALRRGVERVRHPGHRREHGARLRTPRLPAGVDLRGTGATPRGPDQRGAGRGAGRRRRVPGAGGGRRRPRAGPDRGEPDPAGDRPAPRDRHRRASTSRPTAARTSPARRRSVPCGSSAPNRRAGATSGCGSRSSTRRTSRSAALPGRPRARRRRVGDPPPRPRPFARTPVLAALVEQLDAVHRSPARQHVGEVRSRAGRVVPEVVPRADPDSRWREGRPDRWTAGRCRPIDFLQERQLTTR